MQHGSNKFVRDKLSVVRKCGRCWLVERRRKEIGLFGGTVVTKRGTAQADKLVRGKSSGWLAARGRIFKPAQDCDLDWMPRLETRDKEADGF